MKRSRSDVAAPAADVTRLCHDLRQYVAAGILLTEQSQDQPLDPLTRARLGTIRQVLARMSEFIAAETGAAEPQPWLVDLVDLVEECVTVVTLSHAVDVTVAAAGDAVAYADPVLLRRAVTNVLDNASRAAGRSGTVTVRVDSDQEESYVEVADDGLGFGRIAPGTGHGLSTVTRALRECHGRLEISSVRGHGTTVRMVVPNQCTGATS